MIKPFVSIIVPVYQVEPFVEACIQSVMCQTYDGKLECIIIDDGGTDRSMDLVEGMIKRYQGPFSFKILHHTQNRGLSAARNTGIDEAQGDYLYFLDSDDELTADCIESLARPLAKERYDVVLGFVKYQQVLTRNTVVDTCGPQELNITEDILLRPPEILDSYKKKWAVVAWNRLCRADFLRQNQLRFKEGLFYEDNLWSFQIACLAQSLYIISRAVYVHKLRAGSIMDMSTRKEYSDSWKTILMEMRAFADRHPIDNAKVFPAFDAAFRTVLAGYSYCPDKYAAAYRSMRRYVKAPLSNILLANGFKIKGILQDLHYRLPLHAAPFWLLNGRKYYHKLHHLKNAVLLDLTPQVYISKKWKRYMGYSLDWDHPRDLNEKIQWLLVNGDISEWTRLADKYQVREYVREKGLEELLVPMLGVWTDAEQIDFDRLPDKFVLKCTHDCGSTVVVDKAGRDFNQAAICWKMNEYLRRNYGDNGEMHYRGIPPRIIAEAFLEMTEAEKAVSTSHIDYKVWCFDGKPCYVNCFYNRTKLSVMLDVYDLDWQYHPEYVVSHGHYRSGAGLIGRPASLPEMLEAAATLSKGFPEVRIDFYDIDGRLYFGEMTFTSAAGLMRFYSPDFLKILGDKIILNQ